VGAPLTLTTNTETKTTKPKLQRKRNNFLRHSIRPFCFVTFLISHITTTLQHVFSANQCHYLKWNSMFFFFFTSYFGIFMLHVSVSFYLQYLITLLFLCLFDSQCFVTMHKFLNRQHTYCLFLFLLLMQKYNKLPWLIWILMKLLFNKIDFLLLKNETRIK